MQSCGFICSFLLLFSLLGVLTAKHAKLPDVFKNKITFSQEFCNRLQNECDKGICSKCCEQYEKGCDTFADWPDNPIKIARSEDELEKQIKQINSGFKGELGIEKLTRPVILEDGTEIRLHRREDLEEIFDIKNILSDGDEMDTPFFGLDAILTVEQARSVLNHSKSEGLRRSKRHNVVVGRNTVRRWPETIHYVFDEAAAHDPRTVRTARSVASYMNQHSCVNMVHGLPPSCASGGGAQCPNNYIVIVGGHGGGCSSNVGMTGGAQGIHMGSGCGQFGAGYRQFSHALGASTVSGCGTFAPQPAQVPVVNQAALTPSFCSMQYLNNLYCTTTCVQQQNTCWNGGYLNPANCGICICPPLYCGPTCQIPCGCVTPPCPSPPPPPPPYTPRPPPPPGCQVSEWSVWSECSLTCGQGSKRRQRMVISGDIALCSMQVDLHDSIQCFLRECPGPPPSPVLAIDCAVSDWSSWATTGECSRTCGRPCDTQRTRDIIQYPSSGGRACPELEERSLRTLPECIPVDCQMTEWSSWTQCDQTCGQRCENRRWRSVTRQPENGGTSCDYFELDEVRFEDIEECPVPVDCEVSKWSSWSSCSESCGDDCQVERNREIVRQESYGGRACSTYNLREVEIHVLEHCPIDCQMSEWSDWSHCTQTCGNCEVKRWRSVIRHAQFGGRECAEGGDSWFGGGGDALEELKTMTLPDCPIPVDARVSEWLDWSSCSQTCDFCTQSRNRSCLEEAVLTGRRCDTYSMFEQRQHNMGDCPVPQDCKVSTWGSWSECSQTCGMCQRVRYRQIVSEAVNGGRQCSEHYYRLMESQTHNLGECPLNCEVSNWSEWIGCTATCGTCVASRRRSITRYPEHGGSPCPVELSETTSLQQRACPMNCEVSNWSEWSGCTATCGECVASRHRSITMYPEHGGSPCPVDLAETTSLQQRACPPHPQDCKLTNWSALSACDRTCGHCYKKQERSIWQEEEHGGRPCKDYCLVRYNRTQLLPCPRLRRRNAARERKIHPQV